MDPLEISARLVARTALHVGGWRAAEGVDALLRRNAQGEVFIPGSAVGGPLRAIATRLAPRLGGGVCRALTHAADGPGATGKAPRMACQCLVCRLFGAIDPQESNQVEVGGAASHLWVYDATGAAPRPTTVRDGVGIERRTAAASRAESLKYNLELLPAGATFGLRLEVRGAADDELALLAAVLGEWAANGAVLGGRVNRGMGAFDVQDLKVRRLDLADTQALLGFLKREVGQGTGAWLKEDGDWLIRQTAAARKRITSPASVPAEVRTYVAASYVDLTFTLQATGPFLPNDPTAAQLANVDHAPLIEGRPVLPGASLRGVLRSHAERIARTLATNAAKDAAKWQTACPACDPGARRPGAALRSCDALLGTVLRPGQEARPEQLCLACRLFGSARWGSRLRVEDAPLKEGVAPKYKVQDFLAIDRFTGGGRNNAKFDALVLWRPAFTARLHLENPAAWELGWLALALRDLAEGWLTAGFGAAKGFGQVIVPDWTASLGFIQPADLPLSVPDLAAAAEGLAAAERSVFTAATVKGKLAFPEAGGRPAWTLVGGFGEPTAWVKQVAAWVAAFNKEATAVRRSKEGVPPLEGQDTYFGVPTGAGGRTLPDLYPLTQEALIYEQ